MHAAYRNADDYSIVYCILITLGECGIGMGLCVRHGTGHMLKYTLIVTLTHIYYFLNNYGHTFQRLNTTTHSSISEVLCEAVNENKHSHEIHV